MEIIPIAKKKSERRGIPEDWIRETVNFPTQIVEGYEGRKVAHRKYVIDSKEYLLGVFYEEGEELNVVITAYLTSDIERYLRKEK
ncbi:MAG: DUF4258 domain-containing protein [Nitrospirae bacterium]|nr:DUF4258 domain-containing protein [Nitrospirota bacterium]